MQTLGLGALVGGLLMAPIVSVMYLADKWLDLSFAPFDVFDWVGRILPGPVVTFGIDLMIDSLQMLGLNVAGTAKTAEQILAVLMFLIAGVVATIIVYGAVERRPAGSGPALGVIAGAVVGIPIAIISASMSQSSTAVSFIVLWVLVVFCLWGVATAATARRLLPGSSFAPIAPSPEGRRGPSKSSAGGSSSSKWVWLRLPSPWPAPVWGASSQWTSATGWKLSWRR